MDNETISFKLWRIQLASLILLFLILVIACARHPGQAAAPLTSQAQTTPAKGQVITWEQQGMKVTLPAGWRKDALLAQAPETFSFEDPGGARLSIEVLDTQEDVNVEEGLRKDYDFRLKRQQSGDLDEVRYLELDGVKGLLSRWTERKGDEREISFQWQTFRKYKGNQQFVSIGLWGSVNGPTDRQQELSGILNSMKFDQK